MHTGGERCYLGTAKGASYPNWNNFKGDVHIYPYKEKSPSAGYYGIVMAHGGKTFTVEDVDGSLKSGKVNTMMQNNRVTLHDGATLVCESGTRGFRFGELQTEAGSSIQGYMKKGSYNSYFLVGCLNTDATMAGTIAPPDYADTHHVGIVKEGKGTYRITGNQNYISGALRVLDGRVLIMNDRTEAETKTLRGATGAMASNAEAIVYVFEKGELGGTGNVAGTVDNYGTIEPGDGQTGVLTLKNYAVKKDAHLYVRPASVLRFKIQSTAQYDQLSVDGAVKYYSIRQDFSVSQLMPVIKVVLEENADVKVGCIVSSCALSPSKRILKVEETTIPKAIPRSMERWVLSIRTALTTKRMRHLCVPMQRKTRSTLVRLFLRGRMTSPMRACPKRKRLLHNSICWWQRTR